MKAMVGNAGVAMCLDNIKWQFAGDTVLLVESKNYLWKLGSL